MIDLLSLVQGLAQNFQYETLRTLDGLVTQGKVRHIEVSNFSASGLGRAHAIASQQWMNITWNQIHYSLAARDIEHEVEPVAR